MATLGYQSPAVAGTAVNFVAASAGGDVIATNPHGVLLVKNGGGSSINVTVDVPGNTPYGQAIPDWVVAVPAGATVAIGPFGPDLANPSDGTVHLSYSSVTSVTVAAVTC